MKKNCLIASVLILGTVFFGCRNPFRRHQTETLEDQMYKNCKISDETLKETGIPTVSIQTEGNKRIVDKENWIPARLEISNAPNEEWNLVPMEISIQGRGNTTWNNPKRPFAVKFAKKTSVCGMPKHKRWVLIANYLDNSYMKNEMAFFISRCLGMDYTVRGEFVNLVLNGNYAGLYWLGEAIKIDSKRVAIDEKDDFLIELDVGFDEPFKFYSDIKKLPFNIKNDDKMTESKVEKLKEKIAVLEKTIYAPDFPYTDETQKNYDSSFASMIDVDSFAKAYITNEIMYNHELGHPKSFYCTFSDGVLKAGPVWDYDFSSYLKTEDMILSASVYYDALFKTKEFKGRLKALMSSGCISGEEISKKIDATAAKIKKAQRLDAERWGYEHVLPFGEKHETFEEYCEELKEILVLRQKALEQKSSEME